MGAMAQVPLPEAVSQLLPRLLVGWFWVWLAPETNPQADLLGLADTSRW